MFRSGKGCSAGYAVNGLRTGGKRLGALRHGLLCIALAVLCPGGTATALAQQANRDLPASVAPSETFTVTITLTPPGGTAVAGLEDQPPVGWTVSNISDAGSFDAVSMSVKWGPFFDPSIPASVSYDVTAPSSFSGSPCFSGTASFDGNDVPITGDQCLPPPVPAASVWGLIVLVLSLAAAGSAFVRRNTA